MIKTKVLILLMLSCLNYMAQEGKFFARDTLPYFKKEEIIYQLKRYRIHNNYFSAGFGYSFSNIRNTSQRCIGADYQFHIRREHFQAGAFMSGDELGSNNHVQLHAGYGYRVERLQSNFAAFVGPSYFYGVAGDVSTGPLYYNGFGGYFSVQAVYKLLYDIGVGLEFFGDINYKQNLFGIKFIVYFSNAYKGPKRNINPNVRAENP